MPLFGCVQQSVAKQVTWSGELESLYALTGHQMRLSDAETPHYMEPQDKSSQYRLPPVQKSIWRSPRGSLDLSCELGDCEVLGGDSRQSSMPAYTLNYAGNVLATSQQLRSASLVGGMSHDARRPSVSRRSGSYLPRQAFTRTSSASIRRVSADTVRLICQCHS